MHVKDLEGNEYSLMSTLAQDYELSGNQSLETMIESNKVNDLFIRDISQMWSIYDFDDVEYKIIYFKRTGKGMSMTVGIKAIPLFFHAFNKDRIYEEYNEHMTAQVAFSRIFAGTEFNFIIHDTFAAINWEGFGAGEARLETFKRAINRYGAEFELIGNTVHIKRLAGRDVEFQYRYRLNASNIVQEVDASDMWTYARGYGDYGDGEGGEDWNDAKLIREYTSPLAQIPGIGLLHAPPIKNGAITDPDTMDNSLKTLVDESLKVAVTATLHDLRKQGYPLAQPQKGDRIFLTDERIGFDEEIRVVKLRIVKDWKGKVLDLSANFGDVGLTRRQQSNLQTAIDNITNIVEGRQKLPRGVYDDAILVATRSLQNALTELQFPESGGIVAVDRFDPNLLTVYNSAGLGVSSDGGATLDQTITGLGVVAEMLVGKIIAGQRLIIENENKSFVVDGEGVTLDGLALRITDSNGNDKQDAWDNAEGNAKNYTDTLSDYIDGAFEDGVIEQAEAKAIEKYINNLNTEKSEIDSQYLSIYLNEDLSGPAKTNLLNAKTNFNGAHISLIATINAAIADGKTTVEGKEAVDMMFATYRTQLANLSGRIEQAIDSIAQAKSDRVQDDIDRNRDTWNKSSIFNADGTLNVDNLKGKLSEDQIASAEKWNGQGTYIDDEGVYTGLVIADQMISGILRSQNDVTTLNLNTGRQQFNHADGSYTRIGVDGFERHTSQDSRNYHYLFHATSFVYGSSGSSARWITLPADFRGKDFKVYFAIADSMGAPSYGYAIQRFVCTIHPDHSIDYTRARVPVISYKSNTLSDGGSPVIDSVQGVLFAIY